MAAGGGGDAGATTPDHNPSSSCGGSGGGGGGGDHHNNNNNKVYKGVRKRKWGKWVSEIRLPNSRERIWLGSHDSPEKAARAFDAALYCLRGCRANFNFPDTPFNLDGINAADLTAQQIQLIAARFANNLEEQPSSQQGHHHHGVAGANSNNNSSPKSDSVMRSENTYAATTASSSNSTTMHECDGRVGQGDHGDNIGEMDWTFLDELGDSRTVIGSDHYHGLYSDDLDKMHSGELLMYSTTPPFEDNNVDEIEGDDPFSNQPFLWNW